MPKRSQFDIEKVLEQLASPSVFDRFVKEIEVDEIPIKYIDSIMVFYHDGKIVELRGDDIKNPIPVNREATWESMSEVFKEMREVKVYINILQLEEDVNKELEKYTGNIPY